MPASFNGDAAGDAGPSEKIQHRRAGIRQPAYDAGDQRLLLLRWLADALVGIAVESRDPPDIGRIDTLVEIFGIEALVALVRGEPRRLEAGAHRVEIEIISWRAREPGDLFMAVGEEA